MDMMFWWLWIDFFCLTYVSTVVIVFSFEFQSRLAAWSSYSSFIVLLLSEAVAVSRPLSGVRPYQLQLTKYHFYDGPLYLCPLYFSFEMPFVFVPFQRPPEPDLYAAEGN